MRARGTVIVISDAGIAQMYVLYALYICAVGEHIIGCTLLANDARAQ